MTFSVADLRAQAMLWAVRLKAPWSLTNLGSGPVVPLRHVRPLLRSPPLPMEPPYTSLGRPDTDLKTWPMAWVWFLRMTWVSVLGMHGEPPHPHALFLSEHGVCLGLTGPPQAGLG